MTNKLKAMTNKTECQDLADEGMISKKKKIKN